MPNPRLIQSDLKYLGAFGVAPLSQTNGATTWSTGAIAINPTNNSFFINGSGGSQNFPIAEFQIPALVNSNNINDLNMATPLQDFTQTKNRIPTLTSNENTRGIANMKFMGGKLFVTTFDPYFTEEPTQNLYVINDASDLSGSSITGYMSIDGRNRANGWISPIPSEWQAALGGDCLIGNARRSSINNRWSQGPSAYSFDSADWLSASGGNLTNIKLLEFSVNERMWRALSGVNNWNYAGGHMFEDPDFLPWKLNLSTPANYNWRPDGVQNNDLWTEVARAHYGFIAPNSSTYLTLGEVGGVRTGIAYKIYPINGGPQPTSGEASFDYLDTDNYLWLFDVNDLIDCKNGGRLPYETVPYYWGKIKHPFEDMQGSDKPVYKVSSGEYVESENRLYVCLARGSNAPIILVYELIFNRPEAPTNVTGGLNLTWAAPTTRVDGAALTLPEIAGYEIKAEWGRRIDGNVEVFQTTNTNYTLPDRYARCKISVAAFDIDGKYSEFVWNGVEPLPRIAPPANGGIR